MTHLVTSLYMYELVVQLSLIFVNEIRSTTSFSFSDLSWIFEFVQFFEILFINNCYDSLSYKPLHVSTCGPNIVDFRQQNQEHVIFFNFFPLFQEHVVLFQENSILPLPESLESCEW